MSAPIDLSDVPVYRVSGFTVLDLRSLAWAWLRSAVRWVRASRRCSLAVRGTYAAMALGAYRQASAMIRALDSIDRSAARGLPRRSRTVSRIVDDALREAYAATAEALTGAA